MSNSRVGLGEKDTKFVFRIKQERYIQQEKSDYTHLYDLGLLPGTSFYLTGVKVTKQKGFGTFDVAAYWRRKYRSNGEDEGWYLLTNLGNLKRAIATFKCRRNENLITSAMSNK